MLGNLDPPGANFFAMYESNTQKYSLVYKKLITIVVTTNSKLIIVFTINITSNYSYH